VAPEPPAPPPAPEPQQAEPPPPPPPPPPEPEPSFAPQPGPSAVEPPDQGAPTSGAPLNINQATYEQLRERNLSVTQTGRVLAYRDRVGGFRSLDELDSIPGFPQSFLADLKRGLTV
jgi:DNA uptake protein ComE-like DNA-binding protein